MQTVIHGTCPITTIPLTNWTVKISKQCTFPSSVWSGNFFQYLSNSTIDCRYEVFKNKKRIKKINCKERHTGIMYPSSVIQVPFESNIQYTMSHIKTYIQETKPFDIYSSLTKQTGIVFDYEKYHQPEHNPEDFVEAKKILFDLVQASEEEMGLLTIKQFIRFVGWIKTSKDLVPLIDDVKSCFYFSKNSDCTPNKKDLGISFLTDALLQCNSLPCMKGIAYLKTNDHISNAYLKFVFYSWMHHAEAETLMFIKDFCIQTGSDVCWISLANIVRRIYTRHSENDALDTLRTISKHFYNEIYDFCFSDAMDEKEMKKIATYIKSIGIIGPDFLVLIHNGYEPLLQCFEKPTIPTDLKLLVLKGIQNVNPCQNETFCQKVHDRLIPALLNSSSPMALKILVHDYAMEMSLSFGYEKNITQVLKSDEDPALKSYIAKHLVSWLADSRSKKKKFVSELTRLLQEHEISLDHMIYDCGAQSPTMTNILEKIKWIFSEMADNYEKTNIFHLPTNVISQILNQVIHLIKLDSEGFAKIAMLFQRVVTDLSPISFTKISKTIQEILKELFSPKSPFENPFVFGETVKHFDEELQQPSLFTVFLHLFDDLCELKSHLFNAYKSMDKGLHYNTTKVIQVFEASHQVPTMMGLPLDWTWNATLAFSLRSGLLNNPFEMKSQVYFQPSAAFTVLSRMVVNFPTKTQIGILTNNSVYTSTQIDANFRYSDQKKILSIAKPNKPQKILEVFRTTQKIQNGATEDIQVDTTSSSSCMDNSLSSAFGLQVCLLKIHDIKACPLIPNQLAWKLLLNPFDETLKSFDFEIQKMSDADTQKLFLRFSTSGSGRNREITMASEYDTQRDKRQVSVKATEWPNFLISLEKSNMYTNNYQKNLTNVLSWQFYLDYRYHLIYQETAKRSVTNSSSQGENKQTKDDIPMAFIREQHFSLHTPSNIYRYRSEVNTTKDKTKIDVLFLYENINPHRKWLNMILPISLMENEYKARVRFQSLWKASDKESTTFIRTPTFELNAISLAELEAYHLNLSKKEVPSGKLMSFANFTYRQYVKNSTTFGKILHLRFPRESWSARFNQVKEDSNLLYDVELNKIPVQNERIPHVGWWYDSVATKFASQNQQVKLLIEIRAKNIKGATLVNKFTSIDLSDIKDLNNQLITTNVSIFYPLFGRKESFIFEGEFVISRNKIIYRFENIIVAFDSNGNFELTSHSLYRENAENTTFLNHITLGSSNLYNIIDFKSYNIQDRENRTCKEVELKHNITSPVYNLLSNATYTCKKGKNNLHVLLLNLQAYSPKWNMLNAEIHQVIEDVNSEYTYEKCLFQHPLITIDVNADWIGKDHNKRVLISCVNNSCESTELNLQTLHDGKMTIDMKIPYQGGRHFTFQKALSSNSKRLSVTLKELNTTDEGIEITGEILDKKQQIWKVDIDMATLKNIQNLLSKCLENIKENTVLMTQDPNHPVNQITQPFLENTLFEFYGNCQKEGFRLLNASTEKSIGYLLPFLAEPIEIFWNIIGVLGKVYQDLKKKTSELASSYCVPTIDANFKGLMEDGFAMLLLPSENFQFTFSTRNVFEWQTFKEWPRLTWNLRRTNAKTRSESHNQLIPLQKPSLILPMLFEHQNLYTFDKLLYNLSEYSQSCINPLAYNFRK